MPPHARPVAYDKGMQMRTLGKTDLAVSRACFGTMTFGSQADQASSQRMVDMCLDHGINFIDTANIYNNGEAERIVGKCIAGKRDKIVLASKVRGKMGDGLEGLTRAAMLQSIDETLQRLQVDYLDLYYLHMPDHSVPIEESLAAMDEIIKSGKVRYPAFSNYASWQVTEMLWLSEKNGYVPPTVGQPMYNLLARGIEQEYLAMCKRFGLSNCIYNPLAGGLLTGKHQQERPIEGSRFDNNQLYLDRYWHPGYFAAVDELQAAALKHGRTMTSTALNWVWHHTEVDCVILGASRPEQLQQNFDALQDGPLPIELLETCETVWRNLRGVTPRYNR